jgi:CNT family concentrative nucleoside transporter
MDILRGLLGMTVLLLICYLLSANRKKIDWRLVLSGLGIQLVLALMMLKIPGVKIAFEGVANFFVAVLRFSEAGAVFMFGSIITDMNTFGYIFAFQVLPTIVFFSAFSAILYYLGILQKIIYGFAWIMSKTMRLSGAESLAAAANVFIGQTEAPLVVKPYLDTMTKSEILCLMTGGMATIAGGVFAAYVGYLGGSDPVQQKLFATHLLTASIISAPAAIMVAKMLFPEENPDAINTDLNISEDKIGSNLLDAISKGTTDGLKLAVNVGVMLVVFTALVQMANEILMVTIGDWTGWNEQIVASTAGRFEGFSFTYLLGVIFAPVAWLIGVPSQDIMLIGQLLGQKTMINEFVAYADMGAMRLNPDISLSPKSVLIATYALCGFSNFASIGIQIGGIGALAPSQRKTLSELGIKSLIGGTIACFMTACLAGMLVTDYDIEDISNPPEIAVMDIDNVSFKGGEFQTPLKRFVGTMGEPDNVITANYETGYFAEVDTNVVQFVYGESRFNVYDGWAEIAFINFQDSTENIVLNSDDITLGANTTLTDIKTYFPASLKIAEEQEAIKDGNGKLILKGKATDFDGYFELNFKNEQLQTLEYLEK